MRFKTLARITIFALGILVVPLLTKFLVAPISFHEGPQGTATHGEGTLSTAPHKKVSNFRRLLVPRQP